MSINKLVPYYQQLKPLHLLKILLTKLKKSRISSNKQMPWNGGYIGFSIPDKVAETFINSYC